MKLIAALFLFFALSAPARAADDCTKLVETVLLPATGETVHSTEVLETRVYHRIVVRGFVKKEGPGFADAKYGFNNKLSIIIDRCANLVTGMPMGVMVATTPDAGSAVADWGKFNPQHVYSIEVTGKERPLYLKYADCDARRNSGSLKVEIYRCDRRAPIQ